MRKFFVLISALLTFSLTAGAQIGIVGGTTGSVTGLHADYADFAKATNVNRFHIGIVGRINLPAGFAIQPGLVYNMKGCVLSSDLGQASGIPVLSGTHFEIDSSTGFIEVPLQVQWGVNLGTALRIYGLVEPYAGYAVNTESRMAARNALMQNILESADDALQEAGLGSIVIDKGNRWDGRERLEYGVAAGAGAVFFGHVGISFKYYWDMGKAYSSSSQSNFSAKLAYNATKNNKASGLISSIILYF